MASLVLLKTITSRLNFIPAKTNCELLIGSVSKIYTEHLLLKTEFGIWTSMLATSSAAINSVELGALTGGFVLVGLPVIYLAPMYRTWNSYQNSTLQILNLIK